MSLFSSRADYSAKTALYSPIELRRELDGIALRLAPEERPHLLAETYQLRRANEEGGDRCGIINPGRVLGENALAACRVTRRPRAERKSERDQRSAPSLSGRMSPECEEDAGRGRVV